MQSLPCISIRPILQGFHNSTEIGRADEGPQHSKMEDSKLNLARGCINES